MPLYGSTGPPTASPPLPDDPFKNFPNAGIHLSRSAPADATSNHIVAQVIPDFHQPDNIQNFDSGAVGQPSVEQVWAFKARQFANDVDLLRALIENMNDSVPPNRAAWATGGQQTLVAITTLQNVLGNLCGATANPKP